MAGTDRLLAAASMNLGTVRVSVREEVKPELRTLFQLPEPLRLLWVMPIGHARSWPNVKPRRHVSDFALMKIYNPKELRFDSEIRPWPKD